jgi:hypothetical protein
MAVVRDLILNMIQGAFFIAVLMWPLHVVCAFDVIYHVPIHNCLERSGRTKSNFNSTFAWLPVSYQPILDLTRVVVVCTQLIPLLNEIVLNLAWALRGVLQRSTHFYKRVPCYSSYIIGLDVRSLQIHISCFGANHITDYNAHSQTSCFLIFIKYSSY